MIGGEVEFADIAPRKLLAECDIHLATKIEDSTALDAFRGDPEDWPSALNKLVLPLGIRSGVLISLIEIPSQKNIWLFGGFVRIHGQRNRDEIITRHDEKLKGLIGRLKINFRRGSVSTSVLSGETYIQHMSVHEVLAKPFANEPFPGYESINISFLELRTLVAENQSDWATALTHMKGVYLITDRSTGRKYVGSASGSRGIWRRWSDYVKTGHGGNADLMRLDKHMVNYALSNFHFSLLEHHPKIISDEKIIKRENHWKEILLTRQHGYNRN
ncbi:MULTISPECIES: GIY-YIG nuclease family protein [unclassified Pseudomonas]|uniref:GIY-YIG nuclease family protein n=1 Tax=unclassified Pseudomonas TaxID=196821 RepID=UPI00390600B4